MKISYGWIREFVDLDQTPEQAADRLVNAGIEVASVTPLAPAGLRGVVVGEIEAVERELGESHGHRVVLCRVSTGRDRFSVVCGAPNAAAGVRAAFAPPGATLPASGLGGERRIASATIRGTQSQGMLCSERELGLGEDHEAGLLVLGADAPVGADLVAYLGLDDSVLEVEITPNRPDCLSVVGVARELGALTGARFHVSVPAVKEADEPAASLASVRIEAPDLCARYTVRVISDLKVGPSPAWMVARLRAVGLRPISNVVDVPNYVMWELGHPLHAFDAAAVDGATIVVRRARPGERLRTLDGQERALDPSMLVIADPRRAIGLAGVMGGENTEVSATTTRVLLESAYFRPASVRRTARTLGLPSDAAYRFERGADVETLVDANDRAAQLMADLAGGRVASGLIDVYPSPAPRPRVRLRMERARRVLGVSPPREEATRILRGLGLVVTERDGDALEVEVPAFRRDLAIEDDLVEEVIRVWGYDRIPSTLPGGAIRLVQVPPSRTQADAVRRALVGAGLDEAVTYSFSDPAQPWGGRAAPLVLANPLSQEASCLRRHPLEGVLRTVATNVRRQQPDVRVFELTRTYDLGPGGETVEPRWVAVAVTGARAPASWYGGRERADVYDAKGLAEHVVDALGVREWRDAAAPDVLGAFEPDARGALAAGDGRVIAEYGEVATGVARSFALEGPVFAAVVSLDAIFALPSSPARHPALPRFPSVQRDVAFVLPAGDQPRAADVQAALRAEAGPLLRDVTLFDLVPLPDGRRSLAWRLTYQADDRTLRDDEVNAVNERAAERVAQQFTISRRGA
jgi:phenylalanyl-tRNA synthetase beta chain